jgi:hypothetical protein
MKIVQTFWIDQGTDPFISSFGWCSPKYHLMSWALSCLQLHKFYDNIELITDTKGKELLVDILKLPYKKVRIELDHSKFDTSLDLWVMKKIYSYSLHDEPFLNVDGDVFIFKSFPEKLLTEKLIAQNIEQGFWYYKELVKIINDRFTDVPQLIKNELNDFENSGANAGIIGGADLRFFSSYYSFVKNFVEKNRSVAEQLPFNVSGKYNMFIEQLIFFALAKDKRVPINYLFDPVSNPDFDGYADFHCLPEEISYIHALGDFKKNPWVCDQLSKRLFLDYPAYFYKIESLFFENHDNFPLESDSIPCVSLTRLFEKIRLRHKSENKNEKFIRTLTLVKRFDSLNDDPPAVNPDYVFDYVVDTKKRFNNDAFSELIEDVYDFERQKIEAENFVCSALSYFKQELDWIKKSSFIFSDSEWIMNSSIRLTNLALWIESKWDWANNRFLNSDENDNKIENNLELPPHYHVTLLILDKISGELMEHSLTQIEIYFISILSTEEYVSTKTIFENAELFFENIESEKVNQFLQSSIRFLAFSGIIQLENHHSGGMS